MAAPRATQFIALRNLSRGSNLHHHNHHHVRSLHMTGPATYASPILTQEHSVLNLPKDMAGLRAECKRRKIESSGSKKDLTSRIHADELLRSRAFSTTVAPESNKHPSTINSSQTATTTPPTTRRFNTSRALKAVGDTSTIDFAYLPTLTSTADPALDEPAILRVPILPTPTTKASPDVAALEPHTAAAMAAAEEESPVTVMKPEIVHVSADAVYLPMAELSDDHAMNVDFHALSDRVAANLRRMRVPVEQQASLMKQIWGDLVDDVMGVGSTVMTAGQGGSGSGGRRGTIIPSG